MIDRLRQGFPLVIAVLLPLVGAFLAVIAHAQGERDSALRIALATLLGACLYALVLL